MSTFEVVRNEVRGCLTQATTDQIDTIVGELLYRLDKQDPHIDPDFVIELVRSIRSDVKLPSSNIKIQEKPAIPQQTISNREEMLLSELKSRHLDEGEEIFKSHGNDFEQEQTPKYGLNPKFKPRKPVFFNTVRREVIWTKYAQTHYDEKNPPPAQMVGYRFNILYPDLLDGLVAPRYKVEPSREAGHLLLRFTAGPPYEDVVFRIVSKEWDTDRRSGFTCKFERGVLQLHFVFRKERYRR